MFVNVEAKGVFNILSRVQDDINRMTNTEADLELRNNTNLTVIQFYSTAQSLKIIFH